MCLLFLSLLFRLFWLFRLFHARRDTETQNTQERLSTPSCRVEFTESDKTLVSISSLWVNPLSAPLCVPYTPPWVKRHGDRPSWTPLKSCDFDGQAVISTAQIPDTIVKYLWNAAKKTGLLGRKSMVFTEFLAVSRWLFQSNAVRAGFANPLDRPLRGKAQISPKTA